MNRRPDMISPLFFIPLPPSNLRPFGAPPSLGRRERPREPLPLEGARGAARRGWLPFGAALGCSRIIVHLRRSPLSFIPPEPYPARFARHLPLAGKALSVVILFLHVSCIRFDDARKTASSYRSLPHWGRGTAQRRSGALVNGILVTIFPTLFHTATALSGSLRSPPSPRGEGSVRRYSFSPRILYSL